MIFQFVFKLNHRYVWDELRPPETYPDIIEYCRPTVEESSVQYSTYGEETLISEKTLPDALDEESRAFLSTSEYLSSIISKIGADIDYAGHVMAYLSDDSGGIGISGTAPATSVAIGTDGAIIKELTTKLAWLLQSETDGDIDLTITETGADTWYLVVVLPNGTQVVSDAITFTT